ncbi:MAG: DUF2807 domain-containing protein [Pseudomonadota bacterium]
MRPLLITSGALILAATTTFAQDKTYNLTGFDEIEVSAGVEVDITVGEDFSVIGTAVRGDIERLDIIQHDNRLMISRESQNRPRLFGLLRSEDRFEVSVTLPALTLIESTSGSDVDVAGATSALESISAASGSSLRIDSANLGNVSIDAVSGSSLTVSGTCEQLRTDASSGASLSAKGLTCIDVTASASSGASLTVHASGTAAVDASSGASLSLRGGAEITDQDVSSGASVSVR